MSDNVLLFPGLTPLPFNANVMLDKAKKADLESVVIVGYDKDDEFFFSSSLGDGAQVVWLLEKAKHELFKMCDHLAE